MADGEVTQPTYEELQAEITRLNGLLDIYLQENMLLQKTLNSIAIENNQLREALSS